MASLFVFEVLPCMDQLVANDPSELLPPVGLVDIPRQANRDLLGLGAIDRFASRALHPRRNLPRDRRNGYLGKMLSSHVSGVGRCTLPKGLFRLWAVLTTPISLTALSRR